MIIVWAEIASLLEYQATKNAFLRFFPRVYLIVDPQFTFLWFVLTTFRAFISIFSVICFLVLLQMVSKTFQNLHCLHIEGFSPLCFTLCVLRLSPWNEIKLQLMQWDPMLPKMLQHVRVQIDSFWKFARLFPRVALVVVPQITFFGCILITLGAIFCHLFQIVSKKRYVSTMFAS